jgi:hypothetical protein
VDASRTTAEGVLAVQEICPARSVVPNRSDPVSGTGLVPKTFMHRVVYLTTDAMPSAGRSSAARAGRPINVRREGWSSSRRWLGRGGCGGRDAIVGSLFKASATLAMGDFVEVRKFFANLASFSHRSWPTFCSARKAPPPPLASRAGRFIVEGLAWDFRGWVGHFRSLRI